MVKICIVSSRIDTNRVAGLHPFNQVLSKYATTVLVGTSNNGIYAPFVNEFQNVRTVRADLNTWAMLASIFRLIRGDIVLCFQYEPWVFYAALLAKILKSMPLILLVQDWDLIVGPRYRRNLLMIGSLRHWMHFYLCEKLFKFCDAMIVSSKFLQGRFGGVRIPQGVDAEAYDPRRMRCSRDDFGLSSEDIIVMWVGTPRPWKGLRELALAVELANRLDPSVRLVTVGKELPDLRSPYVVQLGPMPKSSIGPVIALCDIYAVTPILNEFSNSQIPTKVFEGMAMSKPVVATSVSDLPEILSGCGVLAPPSEILELAKAILTLAGNPKMRKKMGYMCRKRVILRYSVNKMEKKLLALLRNVRVCLFPEGS